MAIIQKPAKITLLLVLIQLNMLLAQENSLGLALGMQWHPKEFYLNYIASPNSDLESTFIDGSKSNVIEKYHFKPIYSIAVKYEREVKNPRRRSRSLVYGTGLSYVTTNFKVVDAKTVVSKSQGGALVSGFASERNYDFGFISIPLSLKPIFYDRRASKFLGLGFQINNHLLVYKSGYRDLVETAQPMEELGDYRITSTRDYWMTISVKPEVGVKLKNNLVLSINVEVGITPFNLLKKDETTYARENTSFTSRKIKTHDETSSLNIFGGFGLTVAYQFR